MNNRQYHLLIDLINILLKFLASFTLIGIAVLFTTKETGLVMNTFILLPAPFLSYSIRKYVKHIWSFLALHIIMAAAYTFTAANAFIFAFYTVYLVLLTIFALSSKLREDAPRKTNSSLLLLAVFAAMYLLNDYLGITGLNNLILLLVILFVLLYLLNMYLINFEGFFQNHSNMANVPIKQIRNTNHVLILFFSSFCIIVMLFFTRLPLKELLSLAGSFLLVLLRAFFALFNGKEKPAPTENGKPEQGAPPLDFGEANPPSLIWQYIQNILSVLFTIALIAGVIALILYGLYRIYQRFYENKNNYFQDKTEFISPFDSREVLKDNAPQAAAKRFGGIFGRSNNDKIRKLIYRAVTSHRKNDDLPGNLTPSQLSEYALGREKELSGNVDTQKVKELTAYYEKARYSREVCTKEEVHKVKHILDNPYNKS